MAKINYVIPVLVIDARTKAPLSGLRVEAWDWDPDFEDLVDVATTNGEGRATIRFDSSYFSDLKYERGPDLYFRVMRNHVEVANTKKKKLGQLRGSPGEQVIEVRFAAPEERAPDRLSFETALRLGRFVQESQFSATFEEGKDRARLARDTLGDYAKALVDNLEPVKAPTVRVRGVVGRDASEAEQTLSAAGVEVEDRVTVEGRSRDALVGQLKTLPTSPRSGDKVRLYVDAEGRVVHYTLVRATDATRATDAKEEREAALEVREAALKAREEELAKREREVTEMRTEMVAMRDAQAKLVKDFQALRRKVDG